MFLDVFVLLFTLLASWILWALPGELEKPLDWRLGSFLEEGVEGGVGVGVGVGVEEEKGEEEAIALLEGR